MCSRGSKPFFKDKDVTLAVSHFTMRKWMAMCVGAALPDKVSFGGHTAVKGLNCERAFKLL